MDDAIHVSDLPVAGNYQISTDPAEMVAKITAPQLEPAVGEVAAQPEEDAAEGSDGGDASS